MGLQKPTFQDEIARRAKAAIDRHNAKARLTNSENIQEALLQLEQHLSYIRENLRTAGLREQFEQANRFNARKAKDAVRE